MKKINEISTSGPFVDGNPTFRGGPYGFGNKKQLAGFLNPATKAIEDQEQEEINQNIEDQHKSLGKYPWVKGEPFQDINSDSEYERDMTSAKKYDPVLTTEGGENAFKGSQLPGWPKDNALENPKIHIPIENMVIDGPLSGPSDGTEKYLIDDIIAELEDDIYENVIREFGMGFGGEGGGNFNYSAKSYFPAFKPEQPQDQDEKEEEEEENKNGFPSQHGKDLSHLALPAADTSPVGGFGSILFPKKFIPDEWTQQSNIEDRDMDGIADKIDLDQKSKLRIEEKENLEEKFASKAQARYFYAQAKKGGKEGKKWKKMAKEFSKKTPSFSKLPEKKKVNKKESKNYNFLKKIVKEITTEELEHLNNKII